MLKIASFVATGSVNASTANSVAFSVHECCFTANEGASDEYPYLYNYQLNVSLIISPTCYYIHVFKKIFH